MGMKGVRTLIAILGWHDREGIGGSVEHKRKTQAPMRSAGLEARLDRYSS